MCAVAVCVCVRACLSCVCDMFILESVLAHCIVTVIADNGSVTLAFCCLAICILLILNNF